MATIRKKGDSYEITVSNGYDIRGKQIRKYATYTPDKTKTPKQQKKALEKFAYEFEEAVKNGEILDGKNITLQQFYFKWLKEHAEVSLAPTTVDWYVQMFENKILPYLGHLKLSSIKPLHIQSFCNDLSKPGAMGEGQSYSASSIKRYHAAINAILNKAVEWELIDTNPAKKVSLPKQKSVSDSVRSFTPQQTINFLNALNEKYSSNYQAHTRTINGKTYKVSEYAESRAIPLQFKVLFNIAIYGGLRLGELLALTWEDMDFDNNTISINKSVARVNKKTIVKSTKNQSSNRIITLPKSVMDLIRFYKLEQNKLRLVLGDKWEGTGHLFIQWNGRIMNKSTPYHTLKDIIEKYNATVENKADKLPSIRFHDLRHTSATLLIAAHTDIKTVSARLGHAQTSTTMNIYAHSLKSLDEVASEAIDNLLKQNDNEKSKKIQINGK